MEQVNCNLCGSANSRVLYTMPDLRFANPGLYTVVECSDCSLGYLNPRPTFEELPALYPKQFYERFEVVDQSARYAQEAQYLTGVEATNGQRALLDVGCATGGFLRFMRKQGWNVEGVEPIYSDSSGDLCVYRKQVFEIPELRGRFDAVTAWAVLEHVHDPASYFKAMSDALRPGGTLVVQVPNFDSISSRKLFREDVPRHIHFYSKRSILRYMAANGLTVERIDCRDNVYEMSAVGFLTYLAYRMVGKRYTHQNIPVHFADYCERKGIARSVSSLFRYFVNHPLSLADKLVARAVDRVQMIRGTYGQVTYVARKRK